MPLTTLDPSTALIIIDLQQGLVGMIPAEQFDPVIARNAALATAFRAQNLPVVLVTCDTIAPGRTEHNMKLPQLPPTFAAVLPQLDQQPTDIALVKKTWGAFATTDLLARLRALKVTQVVITGVATSMGVESTARQAYEAGFNVSLATDAMTDRTEAAHENSIAHIFPALGETGTTDELLALVSARR